MLDTPLWLADNDRPGVARYLRSLDAGRRAGGDAELPRRGKRKPEYLQWLYTLAAAQGDDAQALDIHLQRDAVRLDEFARARQLSADGLTALINRPDYLQAGNSLLSTPLAARWQKNCSTRWPVITTSIAMSRGRGVNACGGLRCRWKMKRWCCY